MNYEEKQQMKLERYQALASKLKSESNTAFERSNSLSDMIPFGQPILIGHHSEGRHRRDINRLDRLMNKSIESENKAEYYAKKAENIINPTAISSDNPDAVNLLKEKLKHLEETREKYKEHNKKARAEGKPQLEPFHLSNLSNNIRSVKLRIAELEQKQQRR